MRIETTKTYRKVYDIEPFPGIKGVSVVTMMEYEKENDQDEILVSSVQFPIYPLKKSFSVKDFEEFYEDDVCYVNGKSMSFRLMNKENYQKFKTYADSIKHVKEIADNLNDFIPVFLCKYKRLYYVVDVLQNVFPFYVSVGVYFKTDKDKDEEYKKFKEFIENKAKEESVHLDTIVKYNDSRDGVTCKIRFLPKVDTCTKNFKEWTDIKGDEFLFDSLNITLNELKEKFNEHILIV